MHDNIRLSDRNYGDNWEAYVWNGNLLRIIVAYTNPCMVRLLFASLFCSGNYSRHDTSATSFFFYEPHKTVCLVNFLNKQRTIRKGVAPNNVFLLLWYLWFIRHDWYVTGNEHIYLCKCVVCARKLTCISYWFWYLKGQSWRQKLFCCRAWPVHAGAEAATRSPVSALTEFSLDSICVQLE